jgi:hypothetical protein
MTGADPGREQLTIERRARDLAGDLQSAAKLLSQIDVRLWRRVQVRMGTRLHRMTAEADDLCERIGIAEGDVAAHWAELHALSAEADLLLQECADLLAGAAQRAAGFDDGYCALADRLADELVERTTVGHWGSFSVMGHVERYARASRVIQVRFPTTSIWPLPIVAHELGHFVGPALVDEIGPYSVHPLDQMFRELAQNAEASWAWLQELFADAFAVHVLGPAYAFTAAMVVLDPLLAFLASATHPAPQQRIELMGAVLEARGDAQGTWAAAEVRDCWNALVRSSEGAQGREPVSASPFSEPIVGLLREHLAVSEWDEAEPAELVARYLEDKADAIPPERASVAAILNGAWRARLRAASRAAVDTIGHRALTMARNSLTEAP